MSIAELVARKLQQLPEARQQEVLAFVETLERQSKTGRMIDPYGSCADIASDLDFEDFAQARREMWGSSTDKEFK